MAMTVRQAGQTLRAEHLAGSILTEEQTERICAGVKIPYHRDKRPNFSELLTKSPKERVA